MPDMLTMRECWCFTDTMFTMFTIIILYVSLTTFTISTKLKIQRRLKGILGMSFVLQVFFEFNIYSTYCVYCVGSDIWAGRNSLCHFLPSTQHIQFGTLTRDSDKLLGTDESQNGLTRLNQSHSPSVGGHHMTGHMITNMLRMRVSRKMCTILHISYWGGKL